MASTMVGRTACPECGFESAHVKRSEKCLYRYCPECGAQHHARTERQQADLMAKTRPVGTPPAPSPSPTPTPTPPEPEAKPEPTPTPPKPDPEPEPKASPNPTPAVPKRRGLFS
jgi:Zn-finger nucleic acid-binding protein